MQKYIFLNRNLFYLFLGGRISKARVFLYYNQAHSLELIM